MSQPFLTVNDDPISLGQSLKYLQASGKLQSFLGEMLRQYVIEQALQSREDLNLNPAAIEQAVINFRIERNLSDPQAFQQWLDQNRMTYSAFHEQVTSGFKRESLKVSIVEPQLEEYFQERKSFLDTVILSRIVVEDQELANTLARKLSEDVSSFEQLAREHSITNERHVNGMMGPVSQGTLPDNIKESLATATPGSLIGPVEIENRWCLFRVEEFIEVSLDDPKVKQRLQNELFERWVNEKLKTLTVKMQIDG